jgi:hypothetical protein
MRSPAPVLINGKAAVARIRDGNEVFAEVEVAHEWFLAEDVFAGAQCPLDERGANFGMRRDIHDLDVAALEYGVEGVRYERAGSVVACQRGRFHKFKIAYCLDREPARRVSCQMIGRNTAAAHERDTWKGSCRSRREVRQRGSVEYARIAFRFAFNSIGHRELSHI